LADPEHVSLVKSGPNAISRWREATWRRPNTEVPRFSLGYRLEDRGAGETFQPDYLYGRPSLELAGAMLNAVKLRGADLANDNLSGADLTGSDLVQADLSGADLHGAHMWRSNLSRAKFNEANLSGATLGRTNLSNSTLRLADLRGADLSYANLSSADLEGANLSGADLTQTDLSWANLNGVDLRGAKITGTTMDMADLTRADLRGAVITKASLSSTSLFFAVSGGTTYANCDLTMAIGLEEVRHGGPSMISLDTISRSQGRVPAKFLEGAGVAPALIAAQDSLREPGGNHTRVLLLGSEIDGEFAAKIHADLAQAQVPSWVVAADDETALQAGDVSMENAVYYDRLVLVCTSGSLESAHTSRFFGTLANGSGFGLSESLISVAAHDMFFEREDRLCTALRDKTVVDFRGWEDEARYSEALSELVREISRPIF